jgi:glutamate-ammonia-ligase adenylyltransferase
MISPGPGAPTQGTRANQDGLAHRDDLIHQDNLAQRIAGGCDVIRSAAGDARVREWLAEMAGRTEGAALVQILDASPRLFAMTATLASFSPYLWQLASSEPARFLALLRCEPDRHFSALLSETAAVVAASDDEADVMRCLRRMKAEAALLIALCDLSGAWEVMKVTHALTELADAAVQCAVNFLLRSAARRGRLAPAEPDHPERDTGYVVLAMGKMGAFELNYSSDIDLIVFFDPEAAALVPDFAPGELFVRLTRGLVKLLQERTPDGYVFRVDLRLRPDPSSTQVAISIPAALEYYERRGQNWERSALIKARPCAGDRATGERLLRDLSPFIWRKFLDYAAVADIHEMKRQIHAYKGHGEIAVAGHNIKLGRGGIREIEFFVQTQQLIAGGRHPNLRDRSTLASLHALAAGGWIGAEAEAELEEAYLFLRRIENRLQMMADEQTHILPADEEALTRFAHFAGFATLTDFSEALLARLRKVQHHYARLFEGPVTTKEEASLSFPPQADDRSTLDALAMMGFAHPAEVSALVRGWMAGAYPALKSEWTRQQLGELLPAILAQLARPENRPHALPAFDVFLSRLHAGSGLRLFSLLRQNPELLALILLIVTTAPRLADTLAQYPRVLDALVDPTFFGALPNSEKLVGELSISLGEAQSYEDLLDRLRIFAQEHMFLIGVRILSGTVSAEQAGETFARLAEVVIRALHRAVEDRFAEAHGRLRGQKTTLVALGKLGGREMTATSDLDLILIYDFDPAHPESDGARPLYGAHYFARLTQRLIAALTARTNFGSLYQVDMRLRPSGRSGPVATQLESFRDYQHNEAWTWEHMALTRARVISASPGFGEEVEATIRSVLCRPRDARMVALDASEMRKAIAQEKSERDIWDLKYAGGGLIDVEFIAQYLQLAHAADHPDLLDQSTARVMERAAQAGLLAPADAEILRPAVRLYHNLHQVLRLCLTRPFDPRHASAGLLSLLARAADVPDFATLEAYLTETQARVRQSFERILGHSD